MSTNELRRRFEKLDPFVVDLLTAIGLAVLICIQIKLFDSMRPGFIRFPVPAAVARQTETGALPYVVASAVFLPLAFRRTLPWLALLLSATAAIFYSMNIFSMLRFPPAFTVLGPMIAFYSVAAYSKERRNALTVLLMVGLAFAVPAFLFSNTKEVVELGGTFALLATAAFLGDATRTRREYIAEVEQRAIEAERTREEEALRRVDEERIRIAREVHDIVAHSLSIVAVQASAATTLLDNDVEGARESMENVRDTSKQALSELRSMLNVLRTGDGEAPLTPAADITQLDRLIRPISDTGLDVELDIQCGDISALPAFASVSAYRIIQEALTNAVRHSNAKKVDIKICIADSRLVIDVTDDGTATPDQHFDITEGHGIQGMAERVDALGGDFEALPLLAGGFGVHATIPLTGSL